MTDKVLIYGATGYMGRLVARHLAGEGYSLLLGGRSRQTQAVAEQWGVEARIFGLAGPDSPDEQLADVRLVVNLAGPFARTGPPLAAACLRTHTHYVDIAGEVPEFEQLYRRRAEALEAGVMVMPGVGFGVVPTDLTAWHLKQQLPEATHLTLAYATEGGVSQGTLRTVLKDLCRAGVRRVEHELVPAKPAAETFTFAAGGQTFRAVTNPWRADIVTAYLTTGIPNIDTYAVFPAPLPFMMRRGSLFDGLLRSRLVDRLIARLPAGPSEAQLQAGRTYVYGRAVDQAGHTAEATLVGPEAYRFTAYSTAAVVRQVVDGRAPAGFQTPGLAYGPSLLDGVPDVAFEMT